MLLLVSFIDSLKRNIALEVAKMKKVGIKELSLKAFKKYGTYANMLEPEGEKMGEEPVEFFRDMIQQELGSENIVSFSLCRIKSRPRIIDSSEYHDYCSETIIPLDGDILMHVAPAVGEAELPLDKVEVFRIPKGTMVTVRPGVWHQAAFTYDTDSVNIICSLPERTYMKDCKLVKLKPENQIEIEL